jgi:hypothetical protein
MAVASVEPFKAKRLFYVPRALMLKNSTLCPKSALMCCVLISEQTATFIIYKINFLFHNINRECLLHGTDWIFI